MTDIALSTAEDAPPKGRRGKLLKLALPLVLAAAGFGSTYTGLWSPMGLLGLGGQKAPAAEAAAKRVFVDLEPINLTLPDARPRLLHLALKLEATEADAAILTEQTPRVLDTFNTFLTGIAPEAFERRGILEIVREELRTRLQLAVKTAAPVDVLIMEFALK